ncbi:hypothetical protein Ccrd_010457 [Cynara cardunculus var. scolymus]|uniref:Uncharacterized protein n=1 Tax=Cynara cardunculus var. scolymus TaxID=59895 RepID=A0A103YL53_CYNCS|nr:hypothetical protein Ccrd_010457 [Cynara cardunculus var. scolymus]
MLDPPKVLRIQRKASYLIRLAMILGRRKILLSSLAGLNQIWKR